MGLTTGTGSGYPVVSHGPTERGLSLARSDSGPRSSVLPLLLEVLLRFRPSSAVLCGGSGSSRNGRRLGWSPGATGTETVVVRQAEDGSNNLFHLQTKTEVQGDTPPSATRGVNPAHRRRRKDTVLRRESASRGPGVPARPTGTTVRKTLPRGRPGPPVP